MSERLNQWRHLTYYDPAHILRGFRKLELSMPLGVDPAVARLRTASLKTEREGRDAALFTYGMSLACEKDIRFARLEAEDYDFVTAWRGTDSINYTPVQLKELVPAHFNQTITLESLLDGLAQKYVQPTSTVLAVYLNREAKLNDLLNIKLPPLGFSEVWYFCAVSPDAQRFAIFGDAKTELKQLLFDYPAPSAV